MIELGYFPIGSFLLDLFAKGSRRSRRRTKDNKQIANRRIPFEPSGKSSKRYFFTVITKLTVIPSRNNVSDFNIQL